MKRIVLAARPEGAPKLPDFRLEDGPAPACPDGGVVVRVIWLSLDPYMKGRMDAAKSYAAPVEIGATMEAEGVGEVIESRADGFSVGDTVLGRFGWTTHSAASADGLRKIDPSAGPVQAALGVLGMTGLTAWVGLNVHAAPKAGETIVVSAATGAVGSIVGQLAKRKGLRVVGVAGGTEKCRWAVEELGFDACLDHRAGDTETLRADLAAQCADGVDIYWENVGGRTTDAVLPLMNIGGRIPLCGMVGQHNLGAEGIDRLPGYWRTILVRRLTVKGFIIFDHYDLFDTFHAEVSGLLRDGGIVWREWVTDGIEQAPQAFLDMLAGKNLGKALVRVG